MKLKNTFTFLTAFILSMTASAQQERTVVNSQGKVQTSGTDAFQNLEKKSTWIVEMDRPLNASEIKSFENKWQAEIRLFDNYPSDYFRRTYYVTTAQNTHIIKTSSHVKTVEGIDEIQLFGVEKSSVVSTMSNDPLLGYQWAVDNTEQIVLQDKSDIHLKRTKGLKHADIDFHDRAKIEAKLKRDAVVAVIDTGLDINHPDIKKNVYVNEAECINGEPPLKPAEDKDGNGFNGDCKGWNFASLKDEPARPGKEPPVPTGHRVTDESGHGTHVAGIIAASVNNEIGISGVSNRIKILPIKIFTNEPEKKIAIALTDRLAQSINYAVKMKVDVINLSLGWPLAFDKKYIREAFQNAKDNNIMVVAASGNNNHSAPILPCAMEGVLCVGSIDNDLRVSSFSNFGLHVDVVAPGDNILSLSPMNVTPSLFSVKGYDLKSGTSQAAPYVAALAALIKATNPEKSGPEIFDIIRTSSRPLAGNKKAFLSGVVSFDNALAGKTKNIILPSFKEKERITFTSEQLQAQYEFLIHNPSQKAMTAKIVVKSMSPYLTVTQPQLIFQLGAREQKNVKVPFTLQNDRVDSSVVLSITINDTDTYLPNLSLTRIINNDLALQKIEVPGMTSPNLVSLIARHLPPALPSYYNFNIDAKLNSLTINVFKINGVQLDKHGQIDIPDVKRLVTFNHIDLNHDGRLEYQATIMRELPPEKPGLAPKNKIDYYNYDENLKPMTVAPIIRLEDEGIIQFDTGLSYLYVKKEGAQLPVPVFYASALVPKLDQPKDLREPRQVEKANHIYYFAPTKNEDGSWSYITRIIDSKDNLRMWRKELNLKLNSDIIFLHILPQSPQDLAENKVKLLASYGYDFLRGTAVLHVSVDDKNELSYQWQLSNSADRVLDGYKLTATTNLDTLATDEVAMVGAQRGTMWEKVTLYNNYTESTLTKIESQDDTEEFRIFVKGYKSGNTRYSFLQAMSESLFSIERDGHIKYATRPYYVSTFLPGYLFAEKGYPIWYRSNRGALPTLYVDASQIVTRNAYIIVGNDEGLTAPARMNILIPDSCISLNPSLWDNKTYKFTLLCNEDRKWYLTMLPIQD